MLSIHLSLHLLSVSQELRTSTTYTLMATKRSLEKRAGNKSSFSPEKVRPFPKAGPRKISSKGRSRRKSAILTNTPVKKAIEEEEKQVKQTGQGRKSQKKDLRMKMTVSVLFASKPS
ncbi:hypothetical protein SNE40_003282 [Patella caerulea]